MWGYVVLVCGRTMITVSRREVADLLAVERVEADELPISWNVAPTQPLYLVRTASTGERVLSSPRWGLVPSWSATPNPPLPLINARAETISESPVFRSLTSNRRGLVVVSGFYEWERHGPARTTGVPFFFQRSDDKPLVLAALWDRWSDGESRSTESCTIITTSANSTMARVHHRMPVVLGPQAWREWLQPGPLSPQRMSEILVPAPDDVLRAYPVGTDVNNAQHNGPSLVRPAPARPVADQLALFDMSPRSTSSRPGPVQPEPQRVAHH